jgi:serine/threonine protein kinase
MYDANEIGLDWQGTLDTVSSIPNAKSAFLESDGLLRTHAGTVLAIMEIEPTFIDSTMGKLAWAKKTTPGQPRPNDCLVKCPSSQRHSKQEAVIQWLCYRTLRAAGLGDHCPPVFDIFTYSKKVWFSMAPIYKAPILDTYLKTLPTWRIKSPKNGIHLLRIIGQVAICCLVLDGTIGFNHRDLKPSNLLIKTDDIKSHTVAWKGLDITIHASPTTVLVDYGFACLGPGKIPWIQAGDDVLSSFDACPRVGRDVFMLLVFLLWSEDIRESLIEEHLDFLRSSLRLSTERWTQMVQLKSNPAEWIYTLITERGFQCPALDPLTWLQTCSTRFPEVVTIRGI